MADSEAAVIGAGPTGCLLACFLARRGYRVTLYERRPDPRGEDAAGPGRPGGLALSERGLDALRRVGVGERVLAGALPMRGRLVHPVEGGPEFHPYSRGGDRAISSIGRGDLDNALLDAAGALPGVRIEFRHRIVALDPDGPELAFETPRGAVRVTAQVVLGADGAGSTVRAQLAARAGLTETVDPLGYDYRELTIPPLGGDFALAPDVLHVWPRGASMMIARPNPDRSFTGTLFVPARRAGGPEAPGGALAVEEHLRAHYPELLALAPGPADGHPPGPVGQLGTVRRMPWHLGGVVGLLGDAAHPIVPLDGQGADCAFEDVVELDRCLEETGDTWEMALPLFETRRREHAEAIARMVLASFVETRDRRASPLFRLGRRIEHAVARTLPDGYVSRDELVSFSCTPYAEVERRVRRRRRVAAGVAGAAALALGAVGGAAVRGGRGRA